MLWNCDPWSLLPTVPVFWGDNQRTLTDLSLPCVSTNLAITFPDRCSSTEPETYVTSLLRNTHDSIWIEAATKQSEVDSPQWVRAGEHSSSACRPSWSSRWFCTRSRLPGTGRSPHPPLRPGAGTALCWTPFLRHSGCVQQEARCRQTWSFTLTTLFQGWSKDFSVRKQQSKVWAHKHKHLITFLQHFIHDPYFEQQNYSESELSASPIFF